MAIGSQPFGRARKVAPEPPDPIARGVRPSTPPFGTCLGSLLPMWRISSLARSLGYTRPSSGLAVGLSRHIFVALQFENLVLKAIRGLPSSDQVRIRSRQVITISPAYDQDGLRALFTRRYVSKGSLDLAGNSDLIRNFGHNHKTREAKPNS